MEKKKKLYKGMKPLQFWTIIWGIGLAGQLCWNIENQWFNTFVYAKISGDVNIVTSMVIVSAFVTALSTFLFGTLSDRLGKRKIFMSVGYIIWGCATILFGMTEYARVSGIGVLISLSGFLVVLTDAIMSFFGSMGCDAGYNVWVNDYTDDSNKGQVGAALAVLPVFGTVIGTVVGGMLVNIGNPTVGTDAYDPSLDNYQMLFWFMGIFVIVIGILSIFLVKDASKLINQEKIPFVVLISVLTNAIGLFLLSVFIKSPADVNGEVLFSADNIPIFVCVFLVGTGYILIMQACMIWVRGLFPEGCRGQLEGVRSMAFTLMPMFLGTIIGNIIIKNTPQTDIRYDVYGHVIDVPQENLFLIASGMVLLTLIPLYFAAKEYNKRVKKQ